MIEALKPTEDELDFIRSNPDFQVCIERWGKGDGMLRFAIVPVDLVTWRVYLEGNEDSWTRLVQIEPQGERSFDGFNTCLMFIKNVEAQLDEIRRLEQSVSKEEKEEEEPTIEEPSHPLIEISDKMGDQIMSTIGWLGTAYIFYLVIAAFLNFLHR